MTAGHQADLDAVDRDALQRAMEIAKRDPQRAKQLESKLRDEPWSDVAEFASYACQVDALSLKPWEEPPCHADEDDPGERDKAGQKLLRKMLQSGVSRYDPDPLKALERAKKRRRVKV